MKKNFYILFLFLTTNIYGQITSPVMRANFGTDADLRADFFNAVWTGNGDDWFSDTTGTGVQVIDTTGAAAIVARYAIDPNFRMTSFSREMNFPAFSTINNKLLLGAAFIRDYHDKDSTSFSGSKNGDSPATWFSPQSQPIPNKNDILDVMAHVRRDGPGMTDSLWMFGGVSIEGTTGDRYFDFEMYQTNLSFDKSTGTFSGYGPDAGHTSWKFDGAGNVISPGDIIFSADYGNSSLSSIEARIWVNSASLSITPAGFSWSGTFDGASNGALYGYAGIVPKTAGNFYTGIENATNVWAGHFSLVREDNSVVTQYIPGQFMEFSVNLTKLGLDPATTLNNSNCVMPFSKILVKSRSSTSFTSQLKDFVAPVDFFKSAKASAASDASLLCGITGPVTLRVTAPIQTSVYTWSTLDGHIVTNPVNDSVIVDSAGTYVVSQQLQSACPAYATDTVVVKPFDKSCFVLKAGITGFSGSLLNKKAALSWSVKNNNEISYFEIEHSPDGIHFSRIGRIDPGSSGFPDATYQYIDVNAVNESAVVYYRIKMVNIANKVSYSSIIRLAYDENTDAGIKIYPNPVRDYMQICVYSRVHNNMEVSVYDAAGRLMRTIHSNVPEGSSKLTMTGIQGWPDGIYSVKVISGNDIFINKMILQKDR